jgi:FHA domain
MLSSWRHLNRIGLSDHLRQTCDRDRSPAPFGPFVATSCANATHRTGPRGNVRGAGQAGEGAPLTADGDQEVIHTGNDQTTDEGAGDTTSAFRADFLGQLDTSGAEAGMWGVEPLPSDSALLVVERGPNVGSRFLLDRPVTSAGRHPGSDIFLDDITASRRHAEFRRDNGEFRVVDTGSLNGTYVNRQPVQSAVLANGDEIQIGKFRLVFLTNPVTG